MTSTTNSTRSSGQIMNRVVVIVLRSITMVFLVQSVYFGNQALASSSNTNNECPIFSIKYGCDLSAWFHLIIDGLIAAFLGIFFHHLAHKQSLKLKKIVEEHDAMRKRRREFAIQSLKNHFTTLLFSMSLINKLEAMYASDTKNRDNIKDQINRNYEIISRVINDIKNILLFLNDVLEPQIINDVNQLCQTINQGYVKDENKQLRLIDYTETKNKINGLCKTFDEVHPAVVPVHELFERTSPNSPSNNRSLKKLNYQEIVLYCRHLFKKVDSSK
ncbi:MAG: hypothetical protein WBP64_07575 [Nitrososphaeraceae archaeon]